jgi:hypothetical protein
MMPGAHNVKIVGNQLRFKPETLKKAGFEPEYKYKSTSIRLVPS